ncbi:hypothetical protein GO491_02915 [Flavobacteriaceae bacterium Ap0902]|nr:hypothetical protein [Flavobacteriaceae bacterium Ap0902]
MSLKYQEDLAHIRSMMEKSSRFISLSGLSGIFAGIFALIGAGVAHYLLERYEVNYFDGATTHTYAIELILNLMLVALAVLVFSIAFGIYFTIQKSKKQNISFWNLLTKNVLVHLAVPLIAGGVFCLALINQGHNYLIAPEMLIFYGLALVNVSKFTYGDVRWLGYLEIFLGLIAAFYTGYGLVFWALGFGVLHIIYGIIMFNKYDK